MYIFENIYILYNFYMADIPLLYFAPLNSYAASRYLNLNVLKSSNPRDMSYEALICLFKSHYLLDCYCVFIANGPSEMVEVIARVSHFSAL